MVSVLSKSCPVMQLEAALFLGNGAQYLVPCDVTPIVLIKIMKIIGRDIKKI